MNRMIKNISMVWVDTSYNGKAYKIGPKRVITLDDGGNDEHAADYLLQTFGFLKEVTPKVTYPITQVRKAYGSKTPTPVREVKKEVVKPTKPTTKPIAKPQAKSRRTNKRGSRK